MKDRLKSLRKELGLTQEEFAKRINIKRNTLANYEIGRNNPIDAVISLICKEFNVNEKWLRTGSGEMFKESAPSEEVGYFVESLLENDENPFYSMTIDMLKTYHELDDKSKEVIRQYFKKIKESNKKEES